HETETGRVERRIRAATLLEPCERERGEEEADLHVEPEDPVPRDTVHDCAADKGSDRDGKPADAYPDPEREPAPFARHGRRKNREGERSDDRAADPLERARDVERVGARRESSGR